MNWHTLTLFAPLLTLLLLAAAIDLHRRRIPNWLTAMLALTGLMQAFTPCATAARPATSPGVGWGGG
jgi:Flp pilus assembly protein protease CpaA